MYTSREIFIKLLQSGLWNQPLLSSFDPLKVKWDEVYNMSMKQSVWGVVTDAINNLPAECQPPIKLQQQMNYLLSRNRTNHARLNDTLVKIVSMLYDNGISPVLLKGQGVATYYHDPTLRCCGDIDLYIGLENYDSACKIAKQFGEEKESIESTKHYHFMHNGVAIELHRIAEQLPGRRYNNSFQKWTKEMLTADSCRRLKFAEADVLVPPADFEVLYIFNHAFHHFLNGGVGLRQLCDWTLALDKYNGIIDLQMLENNLNKFGLMRGWKLFGCIATDVIGLPKDKFPFYDSSYLSKSEKVLNMIFNEGNFGFHAPERGKRPDGYIAGKWHTFKNTHRRYLLLINSLPSEVIRAWKSYISVGLLQLVKDKLNK